MAPAQTVFHVEQVDGGFIVDSYAKGYTRSRSVAGTQAKLVRVLRSWLDAIDPQPAESETEAK